MNSTLQSKMHYEGKLHTKKVHQFLTEYNQRNSLPPPKKLKLEKNEEVSHLDYQLVMNMKIFISFYKKKTIKQFS